MEEKKTVDRVTAKKKIPAKNAWIFTFNNYSETEYEDICFFLKQNQHRF